jgi:hypothetical protein
MNVTYSIEGPDQDVHMEPTEEDNEDMRNLEEIESVNLQILSPILLSLMCLCYLRI